MPRRRARSKLVKQKKSVLKRNWLELPNDVTTKILQKLGAIEILDSAQKVCTTWRRICKDPAMWRVIDMQDSDDSEDFDGLPYDAVELYKNAIDRSQGQLIDINIKDFAELMDYMAKRSPQLRCLQIRDCDCSKESWTDFFSKIPLLEELTLISTRISLKAIGDANQYCSKLRSITYISYTYDPHDIEGYANLILNYVEVLAIAINMTQLRHLQLVGYAITKGCLKAILDGCPQLESLNMQCCFSVKLDENIKERCRKQIKDLSLPVNDANFSGEAEDSEEDTAEDSEEDTDFSETVEDRFARLDDKFFEGIDTSKLSSSPQQLRSEMTKRLCSFNVWDLV